MTSAQPSDPLFAGKFRMLKLLGRGAMGEVWLAMEEGPSNFSRQVAVKRLLATEDMSEVARQSFVAEARALARLDHPNIVRLIELGESDDRGLYLVLDFVDGAALDRIIRKTGPLSPAATALIGREVGRALQAVHVLSDDQGNNLGVVHRDVSPANILIGKDGRIRLSDFGVARITGLGGEKTETGVFKGKLPYMPPEQALGEPFDGRADLFSLGITIYEALLGGRLRKAETQGQLIARIATERPPRVHDLLPEVPETLARVIDLSTEFKSAERVEHAGVFISMLNQAIHEFGPGAEEEAIREIRERVQQVATGAPPQARAPWSLALASEHTSDNYKSNSGVGEGMAALGNSGPHSLSGVKSGVSTRGSVEEARNASVPPPSSTGSGRIPTTAFQSESTGSFPPGQGQSYSTGSGAIARPTTTGTGSTAAAAAAQGITLSSAPVHRIDSSADLGRPNRTWLLLVGALVLGGGLALWLLLGRNPDSGKTADSGAPSTNAVNTGVTTDPNRTAAASPSQAAVSSPSSAPSASLPASASHTGHPDAPHPIGPGPGPKPVPSADPGEDPSQPGTLVVVVNPWGNVSVDGRAVGTTPIAPVSLPAGNHSVVVTNSELGATRSQTVKVVGGKQAFARFDLKKSD